MNNSNNNSYKLPKGFVFILAMLTSISPLAIDTYLPSFLQISQTFSTSINNIELTLSIYLFGFAIGQLIGGPLSDKYGRKNFIFVGIGIYILFSLLISISSSIEQMLFFRFMQAIGGGFAVVNTNAIVRDIYHGKKGAKVFSIISMIMMMAPLLAPVIGAVIVSYYEWQVIFIVIALYAFLLSFFILKLPETSPKNKDKNLYENYIKIIKSKKPMLLIMSNAFAFSGLFVFLAKSSFIYMDNFKVSVEIFPVLFGLNVLTLIAFSRFNIKLLETKSTFSILKTGIILQLLFSILLILSVQLNSLTLTVIILMFYIGVLGIIFANAISLLLEDFKSISGTANALNGVAGFAVASIVGIIASLMHNGTLYPVFIMMFFTSLSSLVLLISYSKNK